MRTAVLRIAIVLAALAASAPVQAVFHLWAIEEVYSNADGSVQFVEFVALASGQQFLAGHTLVSQGAGSTRSFTFPADLPGDSGGRRFLVGTQGFAALGVVTPDYVVPNGFLTASGGSLNFAQGSDLWQWTAMPTDGVNSLLRSGATAQNSPTNFARMTGTISAPAADFNVQGLWWRSPAGSESGWGMNIVHQGTILFVTWFTYDTDGSQLWLVMPDARKTAANTYAGPIYRTTGPAFSAVPFNPGGVVVTSAGSANLTFTDDGNGTFAYTVGALMQSKPITRQIFSSPVSRCSAGGAAPVSVSYQDLWWRSPAGSESGWGINLAHQGDILFGTWFTYGTDGRGIWMVMPDLRRTAPGTYAGRVYRTTGPAFSAVPFNPSAVVVTDVGSATFTFDGSARGSFAYTIGTVTQSKAIERQIYATPVSVCTLGPASTTEYPP